METKKTTRIKNGPNKNELDTSLNRPFQLPFKIDSRKATAVRFVDEFGAAFLASIDAKEREDGSGESWIIKGSVINGIAGDPKFSGWYSTQSRKGTFTFAP